MDYAWRVLGGYALKHLLPAILPPGGGEVAASFTSLSEIDSALLNIKKKAGSVTVNLGSREMGKTVLAHRWAEALNRRTYAIAPEQRPPSWMEWITLSELKTKVEPWSTVIFDDLPAYASNRDYNNSLVQELERLVPLCRHEKHLHLIFNSQSSAQADKYILDCDLAFFKPLGILMADVERPNIRRIYKNEVDPYFEGHSDTWMKRHAWMRSRTYIGGISISMVPKDRPPIQGKPDEEKIDEDNIVVEGEIISETEVY